MSEMKPVAVKSHGAWDGLDDLAGLPDGTELYAIPADKVLVPRELLRQACSDDPTLRAAARNALKLRLHP